MADLAGDVKRTKRIARWYWRAAAKRADPEDLEGAALLGYWEARKSFKPNKHVEFWAYARKRIIGAMKDDMRRLDHLTRSERESLVEAPDGTLTWADPSDRRVTPHAPKSIYSFSTDGADGTSDSIADKIGAEDPGYELIENESIIARAWASNLKARERFVITMHDGEGITQEELAELLGVTHSRVSQIRTAGLAKMRAHLDAAA